MVFSFLVVISWNIREFLGCIVRVFILENVCNHEIDKSFVVRNRVNRRYGSLLILMIILLSKNDTLSWMIDLTACSILFEVLYGVRISIIPKK